MQKSGGKNGDGADCWWQCRVQFSFWIRKPAQKYSACTDTSLVSLCPLNNTMANIDLNKPWIISNSGELSDLQHLPTKTEYIKYLQITDTRTSHLSGPIKQHYIRFKWTLDHEKWWSIEWPRVSTYQNRIYRISPHCRCVHLSFYQAL